MKDLKEFEKMESEEFILKMFFMEPLHLLQPMFNVSRTHHVQPKSFTARVLICLIIKNHAVSGYSTCI